MSLNLPWAARLILFAWLGLLTAAAARADDFRTWTDATGRYKLEAKLVSVEQGSVTLVRRSGEKVKIALEKLSKADQEHLARQQSDNPFRPVEDSPFVPAGPGKETPRGGPRMVTVDWSRSREIPLGASDSQWKITPPSAPLPDFRARSVPLPPKKDFFEKLSGMAVNLVAKRAVVSYTLARHGSEATTRVLICDLERGRTSASASASGEMMPLALHDDGRQILMRRNEFGFGKSDRLEIWSIQGPDVVRSLIWTPYDDVRGSGRDVMWGEFIDAVTLVTASRGGKVAFWDVTSARPICHLQLSTGSLPALSFDRKWIAFCSNESMGLLDVDKREVTALQDTPDRLTWPFAAFSPSGAKVGCIARDRILVWDTASGRLERDFATPGINIHGAVDFPHEGFIPANNQYLVELENQLKLWSYQGVEHARTVAGTTFLAVSGGSNSGVLAAARLPHPQATSLLKQALTQPDLFVFREGTPVKLDVSQIPAAQRGRVTDALTKKLTAMKCPVAAGGEIDLVASVEGPKRETVSYFGSGDYKVQVYITHLKFVYQQKPAWQTSSSNIPGFLSLKRGENIEGVLRQASRQPSYEFYDRVVLPKFLQKPSGDQRAGGGHTLGASQVTAQGFR